METKILSKSDLQQLQEFNKKIYPGKLIPSERYLGFWLNRNDDAYNHCLIVQDKNGKIYGQVFSTEMSYYLKGEQYKSVWGFDLIVEEQLRRSNWGLDLLLKYLEMFPNACATGIGPQAYPIHKKMGSKMLGEIYKYVGIINPFGIISSIFLGNINAEKFPASVLSNGKAFRKLSCEKMPELTGPYNDNLFEIARDKDFLQWRYFNDLHSYAFYKDEKSMDYFVVRTTIRKHITLMVLVDYRCEMYNSNAFEDIFQAVKEVMYNLHIGILIVGSSLNVVDGVLERHCCKPIGRPRPVMGIINVKEYNELIDKREFLFTTFADSDGETNWI